MTYGNENIILKGGIKRGYDFRRKIESGKIEKGCIANGSSECCWRKAIIHRSLGKGEKNSLNGCAC